MNSANSSSGSPDRDRLKATLVGATTILMWSTLALLTTLTGDVPPFQLVAMAFTVAFALALAKWLVKRQSIVGHLAWPAVAWLLGVGGLFGYHFFYFMALRNAPAVEANLINYLWPLLIVLFSALLPGERLRWWHVAGVATALAGTVVLITGGGRVAFETRFVFGYAMALAAALIWSAYSVLNRRFAHVPTDAVGGFCGLTAVLALVCHLAFETTAWPAGGQWLAVLGLGLGPVGAAFYTWDYGVKHGDIRILGALGYGAPLLSTILLVTLGRGEATWTVVLACVLIAGGAVLASKELFRRRRPGPPRF
jgi:drug/metabolite transporter (DMT)-like permease